MDADEVPVAGGSRPDRLASVSGLQERFRRHIVEQIVDSVPGMPVLDAPVPQGKQLADVLMLFDTMVPDVEQVIEVPKIILDQVSQRSSLRDPQLAEQLVEVPTILYFLKQTVDTPVPHDGGRHADLQGILPGQSSAASVVEQIVDIPIGGLQTFHPGQGSAASSSCSHSPAGVLEDADEPCEGFFSHCLPAPKKNAKVGRQVGPRVHGHYASGC